jgi:tetratricopeptide (TPR) repeat protein
VRPDRPIIGGGNNNNIGNNIGNNININNNWNNINVNRPGWNNNWNNNWNNWNGNWGGNWNNNHWGDYWYNNHINIHHHNWYHGCWHGHWGGVYYRPIVFGASTWGLYGWGYQPAYVNPYYVAPAVATTPVYNYSQPVVVYNYSTTNTTTDNSVATTNNPPAADPAADAAYGRFDECLQLFKAGNFRQALSACDDAIAKSPNDPVMHEVRALIQFALGQYANAAAVLNSLLASSPGMDWTTLSSLYDDIDTYTQQLRLLEDYCKSNPKDAPAQFVLAYHYMVAGYSEEAADVLKVVVKLQPKDLVAQRMLESLSPPEDADADKTAEAPAPQTKPATTQPNAQEKPAEADAASTDLVGNWKATEGKGTVTLAVDESFKFVWKATNEGSPAIELTGNLMIQGEMMILSNDEQGNLTGKVVSGGVDKFTFVPSGSPADYQGLVFERTPPSK